MVVYFVCFCLISQIMYFIVMFYILFIMLCILLLVYVFLFSCMFRSVYSVSLCCSVCKCVLYYCHRMSTQLQLRNISYIISKVERSLRTNSGCKIWRGLSPFYEACPPIFYAHCLKGEASPPFTSFVKQCAAS